MTEYIGVMHQAPYLFRTTILNNIRIGREASKRSRSLGGFEKVGLKMVAQLPEGLQTMVDEAGLRFFWWRTTSLGASADSFARYTDCVIRRTNYWFRSITEQQLLETFLRH